MTKIANNMKAFALPGGEEENCPHCLAIRGRFAIL